jgi:PAS domain S-box-containing protein
VDTSGESSGGEVARLRACLNDLVSVMTLPALAAGGEPAHVVNTLIDVLFETLRPAFVCVRLNDPEGGPPIETTRIAELAARTPEANESVASARLGLEGELGVVIAASERPDFPSSSERLLLDIAASRAAVALQRAANELLKQEVTQRRRAEQALRANELSFRLTVDSIPGMVHTMTASGQVEFVNRQILELLGKTVEELHDWAPLVHPDDRSRVLDHWTRSVATGEPYDVENRVLCADGTYRWLHARGLPLRDINGNIVRWYNVLTDIDERKRAEAALRQGERESRLIVDALPGLVAVLTPSGEVETANTFMLEYLGKTLAEVKLWKMVDSVHPDDLPDVVGRAGELEVAGEFEVRLRRFDGVYRWFQRRSLALRDTSGRVTRWYVLLTDIDDRKRAEDTVRASEQNLRLIIDTIPGLVWLAHPDGRAESFNKHYLDFVGLTAEQARDWGWSVAVHPDDFNNLAAAWQRILASEAPGEAEARLRRQDGEYRWLLFRGNPLRDASGTIVKWYGVNTDIEDRKRAEAELRRAYDSFAIAQRLSRTGSFIVDLLVEEHNWSEQSYRIFEFEPGSKITVQRVRDVILPEDIPLYDSMIQRGAAGTDVDFVFRIMTAQGTVKHVRSIARVVEHIAGRPLFVGALQDMTDIKAAEDALTRARSELAHVARVTTLGAMTASIAHEVNQPLSGIITNASTCLRMLGADPPDIAGALETARRTIRDGRRASDVVTRLRALFTRKSGTTEAVDLNEAAREVLALSSSELTRSRVLVRTELTEGLPAVTGDRVQLQQVILNLLLNASDAMSDVNDRRRECVIRTGLEGADAVRLSVADAGVGVDPGQVERLFEAFYTTKSGGMGIGLSVSRSIIESHRGRLWAEPNDGPGATFSFCIPCIVPDSLSSD